MTDYANPEDVFKTYEGLTTKEKRTLHGIACYYRRGTSFSDPIELLHEALVRSAEGRRRWPLRMDFCAHIALAMRSIATGDRALHDNAMASNARFHGLMEWGAVRDEVDYHPSAEELAVQAQEAAAARGLVRRTRAHLEAVDDLRALAALDGMLTEMATCEICLETGLPANEVKAAKRRVLRKLESLARL